MTKFGRRVHDADVQETMVCLAVQAEVESRGGLYKWKWRAGSGGGGGGLIAGYSKSLGRVGGFSHSIVVPRGPPQLNEWTKSIFPKNSIRVFQLPRL